MRERESRAMARDFAPTPGRTELAPLRQGEVERGRMCVQGWGDRELHYGLSSELSIRVPEGD